MELLDKIALFLNEEDTAYQVFFKKALEKFGVSSPDELGDKKDEFFNYVDANWKGKKEDD